MSWKHNMLSRRRFLATTATGLAVTSSAFGFPHIAKAAAPIKVGILHPVTGALSYSGTQSRAGALMAIDDINAAGGIKSMGGAKLDPQLADAQSKADVGSAEVEKLNEAGVAAVIGGYASFICLATTQAAAKHDLPYIVDVGVADSIMDRGLTNTFRFSPGFGACVQQALTGLGAINQAAGQIAKTAVIVHEDSLFGTGTAGLLSKALPNIGITVLEVMKHPTPTLDFNNIALRIKQHNPDLIIPANYYNEYVLLARTLQQQKIAPKGVYSVLGGAASQYKFVKEFPEAAAFIMDCNHWFNPKNAAALDLKKKIEAKGLFYTYEAWLNYEAVMLFADALERAGSADRPKIIHALETSTWSGHFMPYGPTKFVKGQNQGAQAVNLQVQDNDIKVVLPSEFANAKAVFPMPARG